MSAVRFVLGLAGGSGSGKSTIVHRLMHGPMGNSICLLPHDAYYRDWQQMPRTPEGDCNWDHPDSLETGLLMEHIRQLRQGKAIDCPIYDFSEHMRQKSTRRLEPKPVILVEGILLLALDGLRELLDLAVYVETPADVRIARRMKRDIEERGRTPKSVMEQYTSTVRPMHELYVEPSRKKAHLSIPWEDNNEKAIECLEKLIRVAVS